MRRPIPFARLACAAAIAAPLLLSACAVPSAPTTSGQSASNSWNEPATGSLIGGVDGGADQNTNSPSLGSQTRSASGK